MKKRLVIIGIGISVCSLTAYSFIQSNINQKEVKNEKCSTTNSDYSYLNEIKKNHQAIDLFYNVEQRFRTSVTKEQLKAATTIRDFVPLKITEGIKEFHDVSIALLQGTTNIEEFQGTNEQLTKEQKRMLESMDYSSNFNFLAYYDIVDPTTGETRSEYLIYYITVIPAHQAEYEKGKDGLLYYLKKESQQEVSIIKKEKLKPCKLSFTITKTGDVENVKLIESSGYPSVDQKLVQITQDIPGKWIPATDESGQSVDQELIFFFGIEGC